MNKVLKILIKETIHKNKMIIRKTPTGDQYIFFDKNSNEILSVLNGWATNHYNVIVNGKTILSVKWDESKSKPLSPEQKDMLDIINVCKEKQDLQETVQTMNNKELEIANFLQRSLCTI